MSDPRSFGSSGLDAAGADAAHAADRASQDAPARGRSSAEPAHGRSGPTTPAETAGAATADAATGGARAAGEDEDPALTPRKRRRRRRRRPARPAAKDPAPTPSATPAARPPTPAVRASSKRRRRAPSLAALDLGTNNCRLLVARGDRRGFYVVDAFSRSVRLGEGLAETGRLSDDAMDRAVAAVSACAALLKKHGVARMRAVATEACRRAENRDAFIERLRAETGVPIDVITPEEEAKLAAAGCAPLLDAEAERALVFDIGGGSTELVWVDLSKASPSKRRALLMALANPNATSDRARAAAAHVVDWVSMPVGVVTLGEMFADVDGDARRFDAMADRARDELAQFARRAAERFEDPLEGLQMLGTSGTITTLAGLHLNLPRYTRKAVDGVWFPADAVEAVIARLRGLTQRQRAAIPCVGQDRATNLMSGAAILKAIVENWPSPRLRVADRGLREGMLYGLLQETRGWPADGYGSIR